LSDDASLQLQQDLVYALDECKVALRSTSQNNINVLNRHSQFAVYYQSLHNLSDYSIKGFEALIRWKHPELGMLLPRDFVDLVKDIGLLDVMTYWIIQQVSFQALDWEKKGIRPGTLSVNLGDLTIKQAVEIKKIAAIVNESGAKPEWLMLSVPEHDLASNLDLVAKAIGQLVDEGFTVCIDNFSSETLLDSLKTLPAQLVEIDPSLIRYVPNKNEDAENITRCIAALHDMGKLILAKEIETERQLEFLKKCGCDLIQGHLLSRPMPAKEAKELMENLPDFAWYLKQ
jgi:EAL domain-containing protein (putative c-di-GMP-specific phosphodiesterase class I)